MKGEQMNGELTGRRCPTCNQYISPRKAAISERNERILALLDSGHSRKQIAAEMGMTRNAVIGVIWRAHNPDAV